MAKSNIKAVIFDLDGTIVSTEVVAVGVIRDVLKALGVPVKPEDSQLIVGRKWEAAMDALYEKYSIPVPQTEVRKRVTAEYRARLQIGMDTIPGAVDGIRALSKEFPLGLVSGSTRDEIRFALTKINVYQEFKLILGAEDYPRSKPAPDGYLKAFQMMAVQPNEVVIFEDSEAGIASARASGAFVIAVTAANHFGHDVSDAHHIVPDLLELTPEWLKKVTPLTFL